jgi:transposase
MRRIREVLRLRAELGPNLSAISAGAKLARSTVRAYLDRAAAAGLDAATADGLSETALEAALYPPSPVAGRIAQIACAGAKADPRPPTKEWSYNAK